jgi:3-phosphoshikimate 1-carboxyvinyltransferase
MNIKITKPMQGGTVKAIASKSEAHRLLISAALSENETYIECNTRSEDIDATARCLESLGANIRYEQDGFFVTPIYGNAKNESDKYIVLNCGESGSTLRFLLPVCGALGLRVSFNMGGRLPARPLSSLYDEMIAHGCVLSEQGKSPLLCEGQLKSGTYTIPGSISSQYISGLLFALPLLAGDSTIRVTGILESRPYVDMTLDALRSFGVTIIEDEGQVFNIIGGQKFKSPKIVTVEGDWSNAAFWLSAGAIGKKEITCTGLNINSRQGDRGVIGILKRFGTKITTCDDTVTVSPGNLHAIEINAEDTPDLVPILAAVASVAEGKTVIKNAARLRIKESDRLHTITMMLSNLGADVTEKDDGLVIIGKKILTGGKTESFGDHRIAMTAAVLSAACAGDVLINNAEAVNKSYPDFLKDFAALGGTYAEL